MEILQDSTIQQLPKNPFKKKVVQTYHRFKTKDISTSFIVAKTNKVINFLQKKYYLVAMSKESFFSY